MEGHAPQAGLYDEDFFSWYEGLGRRLVCDLGSRIAEAWGMGCYAEELGLSEEECREVLERAEKIVPPYIEKYRRRWQADKPSLAGVDSRGLWSRMDRPRTDGVLRRFIRLDPQAGGHSSNGLVGVHHRRLDVAHHSPRVGFPGPDNDSRQPTLTVLLSQGRGG